MKKLNIRGITVTAIMGVIGFILMLLEFPLAHIIPSFIKFDFSELPALITAFALGPFYGVAVCLVKNLLHLFVTSSAGVGEISNFLLGAVFCLIAGLFYRFNRSRKGALCGCILGSFVMASVSIVTNYFIVYPCYVVIYGMPMDFIINMYTLIYKGADTLLKALVIFNLPFTFFKGIIDSILCFLIYKRLSPILKKNKE